MASSTLTHLARLQTRNLGGAVLESLAEMVHLAGLDVGDRLPPEVQIAEKLGVGRSTVREALIIKRGAASTGVAKKVVTMHAFSE